jgi:hypothetical protein
MAWRLKGVDMDWQNEGNDAITALPVMNCINTFQAMA